jgi:serine/threonine-protein kinase
VAYELLSGVHPMLQPGPANAAELARRHLLWTPPALATMLPGFPGDVSEIVARALAKDPAQRPSMNEFAVGLGAALHRLLAPRRAAAARLPLAKSTALSPTEPALPVFPEPVPPPAIPPPVDREAWAPPAPSASPATLRTAAAPPAIQVADGADRRSAPQRGSSLSPVEQVPARRSRAPRALVGVAALLSALGAGLAVASWALSGHGPAGPGTARGPAAPPPTPSASASAVRSAQVPVAKEVPAAPSAKAPGRSRAGRAR